MPLYEYVCAQCEHPFEALVNNGDKVECPECRSTKLERLLSLPAVGQAKDAFPSACGDPSLPPCGAQGCRRRGS